MSQPPEDPHSAETQIGRPAGPPPPPPPSSPPPSQGWQQSAWQQQPGQQPGWQQPQQPGWQQPGSPQGPPQGPPPGWGGAPGGYGGPPGKQSKLPWILGAVALVLAIVGGTVTGILLTRDDDDDKGDRATDKDTSATGSTSEPSASSSASAATPDATPDAPTLTSPAPAEPGGDATAITGFWSGTYDCAQGATTVDLTIAPSGSGDSLDGVFTFSSSTENPDVPDGSFLMTGSITDGVLTLTGTDWLNQPPGYVLIDLRATVADPSADTISGEVTTSGCSTFEISR